MTQVYITPTHEQIAEFIKEDSQFIEKIKNESYQILNEKASKYLSSRLYSEAQNTFNKLLEKEKNKWFKKDNYGYISAFSPEVEKLISEKINIFFMENVENSVIELMESSEFKQHIGNKIQEKMTQYVLSSLDEQIKQEAKKLIE